MDVDVYYWFADEESALQFFWHADRRSDLAQQASKEANKKFSKRDKRLKRIEKNKRVQIRSNALFSIDQQFGGHLADRAVYPDGDRRDSRTKALAQRKPKWFGELDQFILEELASLRKDREEVTGVRWAVDHMLPLVGKSVSGLHCGGNLQLIPSQLNFIKSNRPIYTEPLEWISDLHLISDEPERRKAAA